MAEWWQKYAEPEAPAAPAVGGNWWDKYSPNFDNVASGGATSAAPSFDNVESGSESASLMYDGTRRPDDVPAPRPLVEPARAQSDVPNATRREDMFGEEPDQFVVQAEEWGPAAWVKQLFESPVGQAIRDTPPVKAVSDLGFTGAGGVASGAGSVVAGVEHQYADDRNSVFGGVSLGDDMSFDGDALSQLAGIRGPRDEIVQDPNQIPDTPIKPSRLATALKAAGKEASDKSSPEFQQQRKDSVFKGDVRDPSTYDIGDNWSLMGVAGNVVDTLGQMAAPLTLAAVPVTGTPLATAAFAAQSSAGAYEDNYDYVMNMKPDALAQSERYQDLIAKGQSPGQAQMTLADIAGRDSMDIAALIGSLSGPILGGTVTRPIAAALEKKFGQSFGARLLGNAAEMPLEAISESGETLAGRTMANKGADINRDVGEGTFNDAVMGMAAASGPAVVGSIGENDGLTPEQRYSAKLKEKLDKGRAGKITNLPPPPDTRPEISQEDVTAKAFNTLKRLDEAANGSEDGSRPPVELTEEQENLRQFLGENIGNPEMLAAGMGHKLNQPGVVQGDVKEEGVPERITEAQARGFTPEPLMNLGERASTPESDAMDAGAAATSAIFQAAGASSTSAPIFNQSAEEVKSSDAANQMSEQNQQVAKPFDPAALLKDLEDDGPRPGSETVDSPSDLGENGANAQNTGIKKSSRPDATGLEVGEDVDLTEEELAAFNRQSAPKKEEAKTDDNVLEGWTGIATNPDAFKHGRSEQKAPGDIARDIEPGYTIVPSADLAEGQNVPSEKAWKITTPEGTEAELHQSKGEVWINVVGLEEGEGGSRIYNLAANYAHNNGLKFVGDPNGISDVALKRRPEQMLSSALKFGTTEHLGPHDQQLVAHPEIGLTALNWKEGNHAHNIRELARLTSEATAKEFPEIADIRYNPETLRFERPNGTEVTNGDFKKLAVAKRSGQDAGNSESGQDGAVRVSPTAGRRTLKRAVITQQLASPEGAALARLLAGDGGRGAKRTPGQSLPGLTEILYSRSEDQGGAQAQQTGPETDQQAEAKNVAAEEAAAKVLGRKEIEALKENAQLHFITVKQALGLGLNGLKSAKDISGVNGFYDPKTGNVYILSDSGLDMNDLHGIVVHEIVHSNMDKLLGTDGFQSVIESLIYEALVNEDPEAMAAVEEAQTNEANKSESDRKEEALSYYAQQNPDSPITKKMVDEAKLFLNRLGFSLKYLNANKAALRKIIALNLKHAQRADKGRVILTKEQARQIMAMFNTPDDLDSDDASDPKFQRAFHGTPHRGIEQAGFSLQKIGTGEGAQAYGYGMYFAGNKDIAEHYRETLSAQNDQKSNYRGLPTAYRVDGKDIARGNPDYAAADIVHIMQNYGPVEAGWLTREIGARGLDLADTRKRVKRLSSKTIGTVSGGQLYHAEIPEDSDLLDYDKPLSEQPEKVREAVERIIENIPSPLSDSPNMSADWRDKMPKSVENNRSMAGFYRALTDQLGSPKLASEVLNDAGIPGLRYLDGSSRNKGEGSANYVIWDENLLTPEKAQITPYYSKRAPEGGNKHGFIPALQDTAKGKMTLPEKPLFTQATNNKNAAAQIENIDTMLKKFPNPEASVNDWNKMMAYALADKTVPVAPYRMIETINGKGYGEALSKLSPGQVADANHGFENAAKFRKMYEDGTADVVTTGKLSLWSFLSRGVSPYVQESLFMDSVSAIDPWIKLAAEGKFDEAALERYHEWSNGIAPAGSGQPGSGSKHNLNAFGGSFLLNMSKPGKDGKPNLQHLHELIADFSNTGPEIRREFAKFGEGVGIDNKVVSFTLLVSGRDDVMVLDRVQIKGLWDDGRFKDRNLYDGVKIPDPRGRRNKKGELLTTTLSGSKLADLFSGVRGLAVYEAIERAVSKNMGKWFEEAGRPEAASLGRFHWETWVGYSGQEASHGTIEGLMRDTAGKESPYQGITAKEGEYGGYAYGTRYGIDQTGQPYFLYNDSKGSTYHFTVPNFREVLELMKKGPQKVVPSNFKVTKDENGQDRTSPWYDDPRVNRAKLDTLVHKYGTETGGERHVQGDARKSDADGAGPEGVKFSRRKPFYSALTQSVTSATGAPKSADSAAWKGWLDGAVRRGEFKQAERDWAGLDAWLDSQSGKVSREQLAEFVAANEVQVSETVLGNGLPAGMSIEHRSENPPMRQSVVVNARGEIVAEAPNTFDAIAAVSGRTKFKDYQIPGGSKYKELLLTLPERGTIKYTDDNVVSAQNDPSAARPDLFWYFKTPDNVLQIPKSKYSSEADAKQYVIDSKQPAAPLDKNYKSSHFDQPNILAHIRFNERKGPNGEKILFLEEVQSDWHQAGRKSGYAIPGAPERRAAIDAQVSALAKERSALIDTAAALPDSQMDEFKRMMRREAQIKAEIAVLQDEYVSLEGAPNPVPDAPIGAKTIFDVMVDGKPAQLPNGKPARYGSKEDASKYAEKVGGTVSQQRVSDSEGWGMLAFKRAVRYAADNGFDSVAWTTGEQQAERYDLSKQINNVFAKKNRDGTYAVTVEGKNGDTILDDHGMEASKLEDTIGKELAQKIVDEADGTGKTYEGLDLKVGGEGMNDFYDRLIPGAVKKFGKPFDARPGKVEIKTPGYVLGDTQTVNVIPVTEKMKDAAASGLPMFSRRNPQTETPAFKKWFEDSKVVDADGAPLVVYHGTSSDVSEFGRIEGGNMWGNAFYFTTNPDTASGYATGSAGNRIAPKGDSGANVIPAYISAGKVFEMGDTANRETIRAVEKAIGQSLNDYTYHGMKNRDLRQVLFEQFTDQDGANKAIQDAGFDAIAESSPTAGSGRTIAVFKPTQIKSAIGNNGDFDATNPSIIASRRTPQTETENFKRWFVDSKVVGKDGEPLRVYHGTGVNVGNRGEFISGDFNTFDHTLSGKSSKTGAPEGSIFFSDDPEAASSYTVKYRGEWTQELKENANVMPVYLSIKKPLRVSAKGGTWRDVQYKGELYDVNEIVELAKESGKYDGVIVARVVDHGIGKTNGKPSTTYVAFYSAQVKSAIGNNGDFSDRTGDIMKSRRTPADAAAAASVRASQLNKDAKALRQNVRDIARRLRVEKLGIEEMRKLQKDAQSLIGRVGTSPDYEQELADTKRDLAAAKRAVDQEGRPAIPGLVDSIREVDAATVALKKLRAMEAEANRKLDAFDRRDGKASVSDRQALADSLETAAASTEAIAAQATKDAERAKARAKNIQTKIDEATEKRETARNTLGGPTTGGAVGWDFDTGQWIGWKGDLNRARAKLDDSMLAWRHVQDRIAESTGSLIPDAQNVYRLQNLMHGRVSEGVKQLEDKHIEPLVKAMDRAGLSVEDVESYMHARHAQERNEYIAAHRPGMPDGGSGLSTRDANDILARLQSPEMDAIARRLDAIMRQTRRRLLDHGIITQEQFDAMNAQYSKYVPLRGKEQEENDFEAGKSPGGVGRGLDGRQAPFKKAFGRGEGNMPINIMGEIFGDAQRSIIAAEKARVGRAVLRIILANPNPNLWTVEPVQTEMKADDAGQIYEAVVNDWSDPSIIGVRHKGVIYKVEIKNAPLANALMGMAPETMGVVVRSSAYVQRYLSAVLTKYNPAFMPVNLIRDLVFGATGVFADHGVVATGRVAAGYAPAMRAAYRHARGTLTNSAIDQRFQEYVNAGGRTGFVNPQNAEQIQKKLGAWRVDGYNPKNAAKVLRVVADFTGDVNDAVENALRFSAFNMLMDQDWTAEKAAEYAKNITVNFNRKGSRASLLGAFFLFYNPGVQGTKAVGRMMRKPKTWAVLGALSGIQLLAAMFAMGSEDDDGNNAWDMLPDWVKRRSLCFAWFDDNGEHKYISIPMSYGFNVFPYLTGRAFDMYKSPEAEKNRPAQITSDVALSMLESFSPIPVEDGPLGLLPPIMAIPTQVQANKGEFGRSIRNDNDFGKYDKPLSVQGKAKTSSVFKTAATILNRIGQGDDNTKPWPFLDYAPEDLEFMFKKLGGGAGSFAADVGGLIEKAIVFGPSELTPRDFPISKRLYSTVEEGSMQQSMYYDRRAQIEKSADIVRTMFQTEGQEAAQKLLDSTPALEGAQFKKYKTKTKDHKKGQIIVIDGRPQLVAKDEESIYAQYKAASKATMDLNERINDSYTGPDRPFPQWLTPDREAEQKRKDLMDQRMEAQKKFNATWNTRIDSFLSE